MTHLTLAIDEEILKQAEMQAQEQGTSLQRLLQEYLEGLAGARGERQRAIREVLAASASAQSRRAGRTWTRDELHERVDGSPRGLLTPGQEMDGLPEASIQSPSAL